MHPEKYSVKWHAYSDHLKSMMKELMMNQDFSDVTLVTEDKKQIKANINILSVCSPVFKDILSSNRNSSPIIYLRGIQYSELESIIQFIYLGEATLYEERMDEFLDVAKSLEIKEIFNAETESKDEPEDYLSPNNHDMPTEFAEEQTVKYDTTVKFDGIEKQETQESQGGVVTEKYKCDQCDKVYPNKHGLIRHRESVHLGVRYPCDQCDFQFKQQCHLRSHIQLIHEGELFKYACDECDQKFTHRKSLLTHIKSWHDGVKRQLLYLCTYNQCDYKAKTQSTLSKHIRTKHEHSL